MVDSDAFFFHGKPLLPFLLAALACAAFKKTFLTSEIFALDDDVHARNYSKFLLNGGILGI